MAQNDLPAGWSPAVGGTGPSGHAELLKNYGPAIAERELWITLWEANGRAGVHPDIAAGTFLDRHGAVFNSGYTNWSSSSGTRQSILGVIVETGGTWARAYMPAQDDVIAEASRLAAQHRAANQGGGGLGVLGLAALVAAIVAAIPTGGASLAVAAEGAALAEGALVFGGFDAAAITAASEAGVFISAEAVMAGATVAAAAPAAAIEASAPFGGFDAAAITEASQAGVLVPEVAIGIPEPFGGFDADAIKAASDAGELVNVPTLQLTPPGGGSVLKNISEKTIIDAAKKYGTQAAAALGIGAGSSSPGAAKNTTLDAPAGSPLALLGLGLVAALALRAA